ANKIAIGQIDTAIACGVDTASDAPLAVSEGLRKVLLRAHRARSLTDRLKAFAGLRPGQLIPEFPTVTEPSTGLSMGEHCEKMAREWHISRQDQDEFALASHEKAARAYENGFFDDLVTPHLSLDKDNNLRPDSS